MLKRKSKKVSVALASEMDDKVVRLRREDGLEESYPATLRRLISRGLTALELESAHKQGKESHHV